MRYAGRVGRSIALLFCVVLTIACRSANAPTDSAARSGLDVSYRVDAARPRTSFRFHLPSTGDAELYLGAPLAASGADTLGHFRAPVDPEARAEIAKLVDDEKLLSRSGGPSATAEGAGQLSLTSGSAKAELSLVRRRAGDGAPSEARRDHDEGREPSRPSPPHGARARAVRRRLPPRDHADPSRGRTARRLVLRSGAERTVPTGGSRRSPAAAR